VFRLKSNYQGSSTYSTKTKATKLSLDAFAYQMYIGVSSVVVQVKSKHVGANKE
jgi:hypothetical protein